MRCAFLLALLTQLLALNPQLSPATFTTNALITEADTSFDGQDIVVSGAMLTVDRRHSFNCLRYKSSCRNNSSTLSPYCAATSLRMP